MGSPHIQSVVIYTYVAWSPKKEWELFTTSWGVGTLHNFMENGNYVQLYGEPK
jgi:hypothetical protein